MSEKSVGKRKQSVVRILIVAFICVCSVMYSWNLLVKLGADKGATHVLNYGWNLKFNSQSYSGVDLRSFYFDKIKRGDVVELSCTLPDNIPFSS